MTVTSSTDRSPIVAEATMVSQCRSCGSSRLVAFLDLGSTPIANAILDPAADPSSERSYPLQVSFCEDCALVQLGYELPAAAIFDADYPYYSSISDALLRHSQQHAENLIASRGLDSTSLVVEVASNDGYLLRNFVQKGISVLGIDPSPGPARDAEAVGVETIVEFFGDEIATRIVASGRRADVIVANNVMAHVPYLNDFVAGFATLLADDGVLTVENPYVKELIEHVEFDTVYHEHFCYFSCTAVDRLMRRHGLYVNDIDFFPDLHGGTCRWYIEKVERRTERATKYFHDEQARGMLDASYYENFSASVQTGISELRALLATLKADGKKVAAYGAAAKGSTLANTAHIGLETLDYVVDRNPHKQGRLLPGVRVPIVGPEAIETQPVDYLLLFAWNFKDEIMRQQHAFAERGGKFIVPLPTPSIRP